MPIIEQLVAYPPIQDHMWWFADSKPRSQMTQEELAALRARVRVNYARMRERMAVDPEYREKKLAVSRRAVKKWRGKNRDNATLLVKRRAKDRERWAKFGAEQNAKKRAAYVGERAERVRAQNRDWYARNIATRRARNKAYYAANAERLRGQERERKRAAYAADPKKFNDYMRAWRAKNRAKARLYVRISKHKRRGAPGAFTREQWLALVRVYGFRCGYCGRVKPLTADHRTPILRGGANTIDNLIPACKRCNSRKGTKTEPEFRAWLARDAAKASSPVTETRSALAVWVPAE